MYLHICCFMWQANRIAFSGYEVYNFRNDKGYIFFSLKKMVHLASETRLLIINILGALKHFKNNE